MHVTSLPVYVMLRAYLVVGTLQGDIWAEVERSVERGPAFNLPYLIGIVPSSTRSVNTKVLVGDVETGQGWPLPK